MILTNKYVRSLIGMLAGAIGGYLYYHYIGCISGTCSITSNPVNSSVYGAMLGGLLLNMFQKEDSKSNHSTDSKQGQI